MSRADWSPAMHEAWAEFQRDLDGYISDWKQGLREALADEKAEAEWRPASLTSTAPGLHVSGMSPQAAQPVDDLEEAERQALAKAIAEAEADPRGVPHEEMMVWLKRLAAGEHDAPPPTPRPLSEL